MKDFQLSRAIARVLATSAAFFGLQVMAQTAPTGVGPSAAPAAMAQAGDIDATFDRLDANQDGAVDKKEAASMPGLLGVFGKADANRDGKLDKTELTAAVSMLK